MEEEVESYLQYIDCNPDIYYYTDDAVCFVCNKINACFNYVFVDRYGGKKMNFFNPFLSGTYEKETELNFYSRGLTDSLNCNCLNDECFCENEIKVTLTKAVTSEPIDRFLVVFEYENDPTEKIIYIANKINSGKCVFDDVEFKCGELSGIILEEVFMFD